MFSAPLKKETPLCRDEHYSAADPAQVLPIADDQWLFLSSPPP